MTACWACAVGRLRDWQRKPDRDLFGLSAADELGHIQGGQKLHCHSVVTGLRPRGINTDNLPPPLKNKVISFFGEAGVIGSVNVEIDDVTRGKRGWFFTLKIDPAQTDVFEKPRTFLRCFRLGLVGCKFYREKFVDSVVLALIHDQIL